MARREPTTRSAGRAPRVPQGKQLLMEAAVRLAARQGNNHALVLREVAREAGLNHNTFYRHFESMDELLRACIDDFGRELREGLRQARVQTPANEPVTVRVLGWLFDFAREQPDVFIVAMRERYGPKGPLRDAVRGMLRELRKDMARELDALGRLPELDAARADRLLGVLIDQAFQSCVEYLEAPRRRRELIDASRELFDVVLIGAPALGAREKRTPK